MEKKLTAPLYSITGKKAGTVDLPANVFGLPWNADLVHQVVVSMQANARHGNAHTKDRSEVRGGGKKPWRQKGTGRARHGSSRSPIWSGGGVAHGPRNEKDFTKKINNKMRQKALLVTLSRKLKDGEIIFVDTLEMKEPNTAQAKTVLAALAGAGFDALSSKKKNAAIIALPATHRSTQKSFSNMSNIETVNVRDLNPLGILSHKYLIVANPSAANEFLLSKKVVKAEA
ncbi:MAG TPA: 50S ribosomal protein L4 [Candidatus Paceibacterota bacterium]